MLFFFRILLLFSQIHAPHGNLEMALIVHAMNSVTFCTQLDERKNTNSMVSQVLSSCKLWECSKMTSLSKISASKLLNHNERLW